ncbi:hypothetical protein JIN84_17900 [Luteolibacter yonseiensis]|uniref:Terminase large subunit n=1 Tax=Luteolibacter yonseiensis TaxID=1144680 RepID=A0A934R5T7_9BACT|nr:hypothetical protein [Luteolibacter yonseiensis]MBK1817499.1 hypothetical protein [Luteolibacter yonseiensis]
MEADSISERFAESLRGKTADELQLMALTSPAVHFACFVTIRDKNNEVIIPVPNVLQLRMSEAYETMWAMKVKIRIIATKPRRAGCSTFGTHIVYHHGMRRPIEGIAISDVKEHSTEMLDKIKAYSRVDSFPWGHAVIKDPNQSIAWDNGTKWTVDSAENPDAGVGGTRQCGFFSEVSKWPQTATRNDKKTMAAVLPSLSGSETVAIAESTPERAAGWQYTTWQEAVTLDQFIAMHEAGICPEEVWVKVFAAWFEFADNRRANPVQEAEIDQIRRTLTERERNGIEKYGWDWEQVAWRREIIKSVCNGDEKIFDFYYPEDEVSCWLAGGTPRFDLGRITEMENIARGATFDTGYLVTQDNTKVSFQPVRDGSGDIYVWEPPKTGLRYIVTCDPAEDITQTIGMDPDANSVSVWRAAYHDQLHDRWRPAKKVARLRPPFRGLGEDVAGHVARLSKWYGLAMVSLEVNKGMDILRLLQTAGIPIYKRRPFSPRIGQVVEQYGFKMGDKEERNALIEGFASAIRNGDVEVLDLHALAEYKMFIVNHKGRAEAAPGAHDDDVIADAIAWETLPSAHEFKMMVAKHVDPPDRHTWRNVTGKW